MEQEDIDFLAEQDITFASIDTKNAQQTNFLLLDKQFKKLQPYLKSLKKVVDDIVNSIDVGALTSSVLTNIESAKKMFLADCQIGQSKNIVISNITYKLTRVDLYTVEIINLTKPDWNVDSIFVFVKSMDGTCLYPVVKTADNKITLNFSTNMLEVYRIYII